MSKSARYLVVACSAIVLLVISTGTGYAQGDEKSRLGETVAQCDQRYGTPTNTISNKIDPMRTIRYYEKNGIKIMVLFANGKAAARIPYVHHPGRATRACLHLRPPETPCPKEARHGWSACRVNWRPERPGRRTEYRVSETRRSPTCSGAYPLALQGPPVAHGATLHAPPTRSIRQPAPMQQNSPASPT